MRIGHFEALAPVCPHCLHGREVESPLVIASIAEERAGHVIQAILHCSDRECWMEFPVIDGVPVLTRDPRGYVRQMAEQILARRDLAPALASLIGDCLGPGTGYDTARQHLSIYAGEHYGDWTDPGAPAPHVVRTLRRGLELAGVRDPAGPALDLGTSVGRGAWELAARCPGLVLGADLNFSMLQLAQLLLIEGAADFPRRRVGIVYDPVRIRVPDGAEARRLDFWAMDAQALPFPPGRFGIVGAVNLIDCMPGPAQGAAEIARVLALGGHAVLATPYDWSTAATAVEGWLGGHSQRSAPDGRGGASEPALRAVLDAAGLDILGEADDITWRLRLHQRSVMEYRLHLLALRRRGEDTAPPAR